MAVEVAREREGRRILVAVDESEKSLHALSWCLRNLIHGDGGNDTVILLYVRHPPLDYSVFDDTGYMVADAEITSMEKYSNDLARTVLEKAENICKSFNSNIMKVEGMSYKGDPRDVICETVEKHGANMLVMGSHGYGFVKRALMGSVSNYCVHHAQCPVVIVKQPGQ